MCDKYEELDRANTILKDAVEMIDIVDDRVDSLEGRIKTLEKRVVDQPDQPKTPNEIQEWIKWRDSADQPKSCEHNIVKRGVKLVDGGANDIEFWACGCGTRFIPEAEVRDFSSKKIIETLNFLLNNIRIVCSDEWGNDTVINCDSFRIGVDATIKAYKKAIDDIIAELEGGGDDS